MDSSICAKFYLHILSGFRDTLVETEQQEEEEEEFLKLTFLNKSSTDYVNTC